MNKQLDFDAIKIRIEEFKDRFRPSEWARMVGVSANVVSNIHGKTGQKPSMEYIVYVSMATGKSIDYFLLGREPESNKNYNFKIPKEGDDAINALLEIEQISEQTFCRTVADIKYIARKLKEGATPGPLITVSENKALGELTKEKDRI